MRKIITFLLVALSISGCDWIKSQAIKKEVKFFYTRPVCFDWDKIKQDNSVVDLLDEAGVLVKKQIRKPAGIMGYELSFDYALDNKAALCYGEQFVEEIKAVEFDHATQAVVSFVVDVQITREWAKTNNVQRYVSQGKQLRRAYVQKESDGGWRVIPARQR